MRKILLAAAFVCSLAVSAFAVGIGPGAECPDRCVSAIPSPVCCTTAGGSTYYGIIN